MPSILPGFEYDIFISYRQNDNKRDGWVTNFVQALKDELEATLKNPVTIYFDENPHDGLLDTHQVGASLEKKLRCIVFIPIISQTYCDTTSFAWEHELLPFNKMAREDELGINITLANGNVASRVLPIKIHDLDAEDQHILEAALDGPLRSIDFIYNEPGVNRPLRPNDSEGKNLYRNQINKVANALKDIGTSVHRKAQTNPDDLTESTVTKLKPSPILGYMPKLPLKMILGISFLPLVLALAYYLFINYSNQKAAASTLEKSIAVLPFIDMSQEGDQQYFADGQMDAILNHLTKIKDLKVISRTSVMQYRDTKMTIPQIAQELGVAYILTGGVQHFEDQIRINAQLIEAKTDKQAWSDNYDREFTNIFAIQSEVAQQIAGILRATMDPEVIEQLQSKPTENMEAYDLYLKATSINVDNSPLSIKEQMAWLNQAIQLDSNFAMAYALLGNNILFTAGYSQNKNPSDVGTEAKAMLEKALLLDPLDGVAHSMMASYSLWYEKDFNQAEIHFRTGIRQAPEYVTTYASYIDFLLAVGRFQEAIPMGSILLDIDINSPNYWSRNALIWAFNNDLEKMNKSINQAKKGVDDVGAIVESARAYLVQKQYDQALEILDLSQNIQQIPRVMGIKSIAYYKTGDIENHDKQLNALIQKSTETSGGSPSFYIAMIYGSKNNAEEAFRWLDKSFQDNELELYWLKVEPEFEPIYDDPRWQKMLDKVGFPD